jgi:hypothetical protein
MFLSGPLRWAIKGSPADEVIASRAVARDEEGRFCREKGG